MLEMLAMRTEFELMAFPNPSDIYEALDPQNPSILGPQTLGFCSNINQVFVGTIILSLSLELRTMREACI